MATKTWKIEKDLCRCCHAEGAFDNLAEPRIFLEKEEVYSDMLRECLDIDIPPVPGELCSITYTICNACIIRLRDACNFKKQVQDCEQRFMTLYYKNAIQGLKPETKVKEELEVEGPASDTEADIIVLKKEDEDDDDDNFLGGGDDDAMSDDDLPIKPAKQSVSTMKTRPKPKPKPAPKAKAPVVKKLKPPPKPKKKEEPKPAKEKKEPQYIFDGKYTCLVCGKQKDTLVQFRSHFRVHGKKRVQRRIKRKEQQCKHCPVILATCKMNFHLEDAHDIPAPRCGVCGKRFRWKSRVLEHQRNIHMHERDVICTICNKAFFDLRGLTKHSRVHSDEKKFECDFCGKQFRWKPNLRTHLMIHTNEKRKICALCDQAFVQKSSLNYHMMKHHPEAP